MILRRARGSAEPKHSVLQRPRTLTFFWRHCADWPREAPNPSPKKGRQMIAFLVSGAVGLLAILVGEQIPLFLRHMWGG
jgi:hypothetical protein